MTTQEGRAVSAIYRGGVLTLLDPLDLPEGTRVQVNIRYDSQEARPWAWAEATPEERVAALRRWAESPRPAAPPLSLDGISRDSIYD